MRRNETPTRRDTRWVARYTNTAGKRVSAGTYGKKGPCKNRRDDGECCAQHRIWWAYENEAPKETAETVRWYAESDWLTRHPRSPRTQAGYRSRINAALAMPTKDGTFGDLLLRSVRFRHIDDLVHHMLVEDGRAASGTRGIVAVVSALFRDAIRDELADFSPTSLVTVRDNDPRVKKAKREVVLLSWEQSRTFAAAAGEHEMMIRVLADCGLRVGEMLALEARHVQGDRLVVEQIAWDGQVLPGTKQGPRREVPLPTALAGMLAEWNQDRIGRALMFPKVSGAVWHHREFYRLVWNPLVKATGVRITPHALRHSFVSQMAAAGIDPADLAQATGHTVDTATKIYRHALGQSFDAMREAAL